MKRKYSVDWLSSSKFRWPNFKAHFYLFASAWWVSMSLGVYAFWTIRDNSLTWGSVSHQKKTTRFWVRGEAFVMESWDVLFPTISKFCFDHLSQDFSAQVWGPWVSCGWCGIDPSVLPVAQASIQHPHLPSPGCYINSVLSQGAKRHWSPRDTTVSCLHNRNTWWVELLTSISLLSLTLTVKICGKLVVKQDACSAWNFDPKIF